MKRLILILYLFSTCSNSEIIAITSDQLSPYIQPVEVTFNTLEIGESAFELVTSIDQRGQSHLILSHEKRRLEEKYQRDQWGQSRLI